MHVVVDPNVKYFRPGCTCGQLPGTCAGHATPTDEPATTGWVCPHCHRGVSPSVSVCPCRVTAHTSTTFRL